MRQRLRRYASYGVVLLAGLVLGVAAYARIGPNATSLDPGVQAALLLVISVTLAATAGAAGAVLGATIAADAARESARLAQVESQADREDARLARETERQDANKSRFVDQRVALTVDMLLEADAHFREASSNVSAQAVKWETHFVEHDAAGANLIQVPAIGTSEAWSVERTVRVLPLLAQPSTGLLKSVSRQP